MATHSSIYMCKTPKTYTFGYYRKKEDEANILRGPTTNTHATGSIALMVQNDDLG